MYIGLVEWLPGLTKSPAKLWWLSSQTQLPISQALSTITEIAELGLVLQAYKLCPTDTVKVVSTTLQPSLLPFRIPNYTPALLIPFSTPYYTLHHSLLSFGISYYTLLLLLSNSYYTPAFTATIRNYTPTFNATFRNSLLHSSIHCYH